MFLTKLVTNKSRRRKQIRYHAKAHFGLKKRDYSIFKFVFIEQSLVNLFKQILNGSIASGICY